MTCNQYLTLYTQLAGAPKPHTQMVSHDQCADHMAITIVCGSHDYHVTHLSSQKSILHFSSIHLQQSTFLEAQFKLWVFVGRALHWVVVIQCHILPVGRHKSQDRVTGAQDISSILRYLVYTSSIPRYLVYSKIPRHNASWSTVACYNCIQACP